MQPLESGTSKCTPWKEGSQVNRHICWLEISLTLISSLPTKRVRTTSSWDSSLAWAEFSTGGETRAHAVAEFPSMDGWEESTTLALVASTLSVEMTTYKTDFFWTWHWNFWREHKTNKKLPIIIFKQFCWPAHPFNCLQLMCMTVPMYIPYQHCSRKSVIRRPSMRHQNSTILWHLLYITQYYQTQSIFCAKCSYNKIIGCAVVLYSLFYRSKKHLWKIYGLSSFYFAPTRNFNVRFGKHQSYILLQIILEQAGEAHNINKQKKS